MLFRAAPLTLRIVGCLVAGCAVAGCGGGETTEIYFLDLEPGPEFVHQHGGSGRFYFPEVMGAGGALFDYDGDGDLDLYAVQGAALDVAAPSAGSLEAEPPRDRLFRNDLTASGPRFVDVTDAAGLDAAGYGMGAAVADFDHDGHLDLYVLNFGANQLWRNLGDGTFEERTAEAGVGDPAWSVGATFVDLDGDGWLDLYVANYVDFQTSKHVDCRGALGLADYCSPLVYRPAPDTLYRNLGDGTFEDASTRAGIRRAPQNGLGVISLDADEDGRLDLYVANDMTPNHLFINLGDGRFEDRGLPAGVAVNSSGKAEASMGIAQADVDGDGGLDLLLTHLRGETHTFYRRERAGLYSDRTAIFGLGRPSVAATGFGVAFLDIEHDGRLDLVVANGAVTAIEALARVGDPRPLHEADNLFRGIEGGGFELVAEGAGAHFARSEIGRGLATGDLDQDGDLDIALFNNGGPLRVLLGTASERGSAQGSNWLGVEVQDLRYHRAAVGAKVILTFEDGRQAVAFISRDGSYAAANDPRRIFGLGQARALAVEAVWPDGWVERIESPAPGRYHVLARPEGRAP